MRVLVTRPLDEAQETATLLTSRGHEPIVAPLLAVNYHDRPPIDLDGVQALIFTSANGARAFARHTARRDFFVYAIGSHTCDVARAAGFDSVANAGGDSYVLAGAIGHRATPSGGALLHVAGVETESRFAQVLTAAGFTVRSEYLYDVPAVAVLPQVAHTALESGGLDAVLLFSARSAQAFADGVRKAALAPACAGVVACCISENAARALDGLAFGAVRVAAQPNQAALLDCLG